MRRVLLLDDEINVLHALKRTLRRSFGERAVAVEIFIDPESALLRIGETGFDVVVSDFRMPAMDGITFLKAVRGIAPDAIRLVLSASSEFETVSSAVNEAEVFRYIAKPWSEETIVEYFSLAFDRRDRTLEERRLADEARAQRGEISPYEFEARRLEEQEPGITKVKWGEDGSVLLDDDA